ncbi:MAG TPA: asparaginase domain-containing protein [Solirubrobacteraceae bacterium]|nr:asparaginase domain-containing protein [Solirubrobacteraceae bacterium]
MERDVVVLATGGTIAMAAGAADGAVPALDARALIAAVPALAARAPRAATVLSKPGPHVTAADALAIARAAAGEARGGAGVVVTHGTDTLEETAVLCDLLHDAEPPVVLTGAIRPASAPGADGPANLLDAVAVAAAPEAAGVGVVVVFGGEVHAAALARKADSASPSAFASPGAGPIGRVADGRLRLALRPARRRGPALDVRALDARVDVLATGLGDDGALLEAAVASGADGIVLAALGGGHLAPAVLGRLRDAAARVPVVVALRPERGAFLDGMYGFAGAERDVRASGAIPCGARSPQAARMTLLAGLGAGLRGDALRAMFAADDP